MKFLRSFVGLPLGDQMPTIFNEPMRVEQKVNSAAANSQYYKSKQKDYVTRKFLETGFAFLAKQQKRSGMDHPRN
jgi:bacterioferritin (cytochrome b1)